MSKKTFKTVLNEYISAFWCERTEDWLFTEVSAIMEYGLMVCQNWWFEVKMPWWICFLYKEQTFLFCSFSLHKPLIKHYPSKSVLIKKQTHLHHEWPEGKQVFIFGWTIPLNTVNSKQTYTIFAFNRHIVVLRHVHVHVSSPFSFQLHFLQQTRIVSRKALDGLSPVKATHSEALKTSDCVVYQSLTQTNMLPQAVHLPRAHCWRACNVNPAKQTVEKQLQTHQAPLADRASLA